MILKLKRSQHEARLYSRADLPMNFLLRWEEVHPLIHVVLKLSAYQLLYLPEYPTLLQFLLLMAHVHKPVPVWKRFYSFYSALPPGSTANEQSATVLLTPVECIGESTTPHTK